ncbi:MAG: hypothetical protein GX763_00120, partial [Clostridiaceae bacterium]|nr:hypothetical protein [Clostridiaceae bacterium]
RVFVLVYFSNGELLAELLGANEGEITADDLVFRNSYRGQPPPTTSLPGIEVKKIVEEDTFSKAGDLLHYSIEVKNTGNLDLVKLTVDDERLGIAGLVIDLTANPLQPGETHTHTFAEPYLVIQADVDAAEAIINTVKVTGETAEGLKADDEGEATVPFEQTAPAVPISISLEKLVKEKSFAKAGDELHYSFTLLNDGIAAVVKLTVNDPKLGIENLVIDLSDHPLMPGDSYTYDFPAAYQVTDADIAAEKIVNKLTVAAESAEGASSEAEADVITPREQILPLDPDLPQTGEHIGYRTGIVSLILGGALVLIAINKRKRISYESNKAD